MYAQGSRNPIWKTAGASLPFLISTIHWLLFEGKKTTTTKNICMATLRFFRWKKQSDIGWGKFHTTLIFSSTYPQICQIQHILRVIMLCPKWKYKTKKISFCCLRMWLQCLTWAYTSSHIYFFPFPAFSFTIQPFFSYHKTIFISSTAWGVGVKIFNFCCSFSYAI